jgi:hypothetical protein
MKRRELIGAMAGAGLVALGFAPKVEAAEVHVPAPPTPEKPKSFKQQIILVRVGDDEHDVTWCCKGESHHHHGGGVEFDMDLHTDECPLPAMVQKMVNGTRLDECPRCGFFQSDFGTPEGGYHWFDRCPVCSDVANAIEELAKQIVTGPAPIGLSTPYYDTFAEKVEGNPTVGLRLLNMHAAANTPPEGSGKLEYAKCIWGAPTYPDWIRHPSANAPRTHAEWKAWIWTMIETRRKTQNLNLEDLGLLLVHFWYFG